MPHSDDNQWPELPWSEVAERLMRQTFRIELADRFGSAFLVAQTVQSAGGARGYAFVTAWHVIDGFQDRETIGLYRHWPRQDLCLDNGKIAILQLGEPGKFDLALFLVTLDAELLQPESMMPVRGGEQIAALGDEVGWYGFPASLGRTPLFVTGRIAAHAEDPYRYLAAGQAYPGMSGCAVSDTHGHIVGVVSSWWNDPHLPHGPGLVEAIPSQMIRHVLQDRMRASVL